MSPMKINLLGRWIEVMAPVFSKAAWRCVWYMIQVSSLTKQQEIDVVRDKM